MEAQKTKNNLPPIPEKRYFSIGEAAALCNLKPHVLRYWEQEFSQLSPNKRRGNRRYYQHRDVLMIRKIRQLLYDEGYTIDGARQILNGNKTKVLSAEMRKNNLHQAIIELEQLLEALKHHE